MGASTQSGISRQDEPIVPECRRSKRYELRAPVLFCWRSSDGKFHAWQGLTRDISMTGVFVYAADAPEPGTHIEMDVYMPATERGKTVKIHGEGKVLRLEAPSIAATGFAAEVFFQSEPQCKDTMFGSGN